MGNAPKQFDLRPTAVIAAGPQPAMIGKELGDAALANPVEHQQWQVAGSLHQNFGLRCRGDIDHAEPAAPFRFLFAV